MTSCRNIFIFGVAIALNGCGEADNVKPAEIRPVRTVTVYPKQIIDEHSAVGEVRPRFESDLGFRVAGKVTQRLVDVGVRVKKGDVLARVDDQDYRNKLTSAETDVTSAQAVLVEAQGAEGRLRQLLATGTTTRSNYDVALKNLRSAEAKLVAARAAQRLAADQLAYCELKADFDGIVTATGVETAQVISAGQMVVRLSTPGDRDAVFAVAEAVLAASSGDAPLPSIMVELLSNPTVKVEGEVREVSPIADAATRTYLVKATLKNPPDSMRFGASVVGRLNAASPPVVMLPAGALFDKGSKPAVWVVHPESRTVSLKHVDVARYETDRVILSGGLSKGDIVVSAGVNRLREKQQIALSDGSTP